MPSPLRASTACGCLLATPDVTAAELDRWLKTEGSHAVGDHGDGASTGQRPGRRIVKLPGTPQDRLSDGDRVYMRKVVGYVHRRLAQRPAGDLRSAPWRYSL